MTGRSLRGKLLVASPTMHGPTFARTVIAMLEHSDQGALGVVINRPGDASLLDVVPAVADIGSQPAVVFAGGPVEPNVAIALGVVATGAIVGDATPTGWSPVILPLVTVDLDMDPDVLASSLRGLRVFAGYAGWSSGQLEGEIASGAWYVVDGLPGDVVEPAPNSLWSVVLRRQSWPLSAVASCPIDPRLN